MTKNEQIQADYVAKLAIINPKLEVVGQYSSIHKKVRHRCKVCEYTWDPYPGNLIHKKTGCPLCAGKVKKTQEQYAQELSQVNSNILVIGQYININTQLEHQCKICEHSWYPIPANLLTKGVGCPKCAGNAKKTHKEYVLELVQKNPNIIVIGEYMGKHIKIEHKCLVCQYSWAVSPGSLLGGSGCPSCYGNIKRTPAQYKNELFCANNMIEVLEDYRGATTKIKHRCKKCQHIWAVIPYSLLNDIGCPKCSRVTSKPEQYLYDFILSICPDAEQQYKVGRYSADIYIPSKAIAIEYNGLRWHSIPFVKADHLEKRRNAFNRHGIRLVNIFSDEINYRADVVKDKILHLLGRSSDKPTIHTRQCIVTEIPSDIARKFMEDNHIQGYCNSYYRSGLMHNGELVALMLFNKPQITRTSDYKNVKGMEMSRFATNTKYRVPGAFSKLLKYAQKQFDRIYTYADLRWVDPDNNVYLKNGFQEYNRNPPGYSYWTDNVQTAKRFGIEPKKCYYRFMFRKNAIYEKCPELRGAELTEREMMEKLGFHRIYDCGTVSYEIFR